MGTLKSLLLIIAAVVFFTLVGTISASFFIAIDTGEPVFPELFALLSNDKASLGVFFTLFGLWLTGSGIVGKRRLENWGRKIKEWSSQQGAKILIRTVGLFGFLGIAIFTLVRLSNVQIDDFGFVSGSVILLVIFIIPAIFIYLLINIPIAFSLLLFRTIAYAEDSDVLERTLTAIGLLSGTIGVFLMLN